MSLGRNPFVSKRSNRLRVQALQAERLSNSISDVPAPRTLRALAEQYHAEADKLGQAEFTLPLGKNRWQRPTAPHLCDVSYHQSRDELLGLTHLTAHDLRLTTATVALRAGVAGPGVEAYSDQSTATSLTSTTAERKATGREPLATEPRRIVGDRPAQVNDMQAVAA